MLRIIISVALTAIAPLAMADSVVIVLDGSASTADPADAQMIRSAVRETVVAAITTAGAADSELVIGLRLAGGGKSEEKPCKSTTSIIEPGPPDPEIWASGLAGVQPHGPRPLYVSVVRAIDDLEGHIEPYRVVIVTAGLDDCDADPQIVSTAVAEASGEIDVRVVGLDLEQEMTDAFGSIAVANTTDSNSLLKALRAAILGVDLPSKDEQDPEPTPTPIPAALKAPEHATTGRPLEVIWSGPDLDEDFLSVAHPDSPGAVYLDWARVEDGNPGTLRAPTTPGSYELRYVDGTTGEVKARSAIEVAAATVEITAPPQCTAGLRFEVHWTGPAAAGDFIAITRPNDPPHRTIDWASTTVGSPLTLAAPERTGLYEVRYLTNAGRDVLASSAIEVVP